MWSASTTAGRSLELPVWLLPGMADGVVALTLGYGRSHAGRIGSGVGFDAFKVRSSKAPGFDSGVTLTKLARTYPLSATQEHGSMEGRPVVRESTLTELRSKSASAKATADKPAAGAEPAEGAHAEDPHEPRKREPPARSASSQSTRLTSPSGRSIPTIRATSGG